MTIEEASKELAKKLSESIRQGAVTVGHSDDTIFIYEHKRGLAKRRNLHGKLYESFKVIQKYVGPLRPA